MMNNNEVKDKQLLKTNADQDLIAKLGLELLQLKADNEQLTQKLEKANLTKRALFNVYSYCIQLLQDSSQRAYLKNLFLIGADEKEYNDYLQALKELDT